MLKKRYSYSVFGTCTFYQLIISPLTQLLVGLNQLVQLICSKFFKSAWLILTVCFGNKKELSVATLWAKVVMIHYQENCLPK
jgi:hypothetical protein